MTGQRKGDAMDENDVYKRANFFSGLKATPGFWNDMEDYHFRKETLYNTLFHGYGIVPDYKQSLHVQAAKTKGGLITLLVGTGMAFDGLGRPVFLYEPQAIVLDPKKYTLPCSVYITIRYEERMEDYFEDTQNSDLQGYQHKKESSKVEIVSELGDTNTFIELARIRLADEDGSGIHEIKNSTDFSDPGVNALDYRFVPWAMRVKKGVSSYLQSFMIDLFGYTESVANGGYEVLNLTSLRGMQTVAMTSKMVLQTAGVFFDDIIHMVTPVFNMDYQVIFEIAEWERNHEESYRVYTTKTSYEQARKAVYELGDLIKAYKNSYEEIDKILKLHKTVIDGLKMTLIEKEISTNDIMFISTKMPQVLLFNNERFTLVDTISMASESSLEAHTVKYINCKRPTVSNEAFYYPDGVLVHDAVKRWIGGEMKFRLKNIMKGRKTLVIRRTDIHQGNYSVNIKLNDESVKTLMVDGIDTKNRWRNLYVLFEEGEINSYAPELSFDIGEKGRDNTGTIWVYQLL